MMDSIGTTRLGSVSFVDAMILIVIITSTVPVIWSFCFFLNYCLFRVVASAHQSASARHVIRKTCKVVCANAREVISNSQLEIFSCPAEFTIFLWYGLFIQFFAVYVPVSEKMIE